MATSAIAHAPDRAFPIRFCRAGKRKDRRQWDQVEEETDLPVDGDCHHDHQREQGHRQLNQPGQVPFGAEELGDRSDQGQGEEDPEDDFVEPM